MKKIYLFARIQGKVLINVFVFLFLLSVSSGLFAQAPRTLNWQGVLRGSDQKPLVNTQVGIRIRILDASETAVYTETQTVATSPVGLVSLTIGEGNPTSFSSIGWSLGVFSLEVGVDPAGGSNYTITATRALSSVPYALYGEDADADPENEIQDLSLAGNTLKITGNPAAGSIDMSAYLDNTDSWVRNGAHIHFNEGNVGIGNTSPGGKLEVMGDALQEDEKALFEVKRNDGQTVFAVYPEGVRVYVEDVEGKASKGGFAVGGFTPGKGLTGEFLMVSPDSVRVYVADESVKASKGGFAVGGFNPHKGLTNEYMRVTPDSVRVYIREGDTKASKGGFAVGGFTPGKNLTQDYFNVSGKSASETYPGVPRVLWYPLKEAFMAGNVLVEHPDSVGTNSWASGYRSRAGGNWSQALGYQAVARGEYSTAIGKNAVAAGTNSFALGDSAIADKEYTFSFGKNSVASGENSFSVGEKSNAAGIDAYAFGNNAIATGRGAYAIGSLGYDINGIYTGKTTKASGDYSVAIGLGAEANQFGAMALGLNVSASSYAATAMGSGSRAIGSYSMATGYNSEAYGEGATALGFETEASGRASLATGVSTRAAGDFSTAIGYVTEASGKYSAATGYFTTAPSGYETAVGCYNSIYTPNSSTGWDSGDRLFVIGRGTGPSSRIDALTVLKNGNVGIGISTPLHRLQVNGGTIFCYMDIITDGGWFKAYGNRGILFNSYGGGWYMTDDTWIRTYGSKGIYHNSGVMRTDGTFQIGTNGQTLNVANGGNFSYRTNVLFANTSGNVGIGTTSPAEKLHVNGDIYADGQVYASESTSDRAVYGYHPATSGANHGVYGRSASSSGYGVRGWASNTSGTNYAVYGHTSSGSGYGVYCSGRFAATGVKSFQIDHPLEPEDKFLNHYCTEGAEPLNVYSGNVIMNSEGEAIVQLPDYFESINSDYRYQLTCIGSYAPVYIAEEIFNNSFRIAGGTEGMKVSWRVEALRKDPWVKSYGAPAETMKPEKYRGKYLHPELYGKPKSMGIHADEL